MRRMSLDLQDLQGKGLNPGIVYRTSAATNGTVPVDLRIQQEKKKGFCVDLYWKIILCYSGS